MAVLSIPSFIAISMPSTEVGGGLEEPGSELLTWERSLTLALPGVPASVQGAARDRRGIASNDRWRVGPLLPEFRWPSNARPPNDLIVICAE